MAIFGRSDLTEAVLAQIALERDFIDVYICDNAGDFRNAQDWVKIYSPEKNLGWAGGSNLAWNAAINSPVQYDGYILLNNDVVLSPNFFRNLAESSLRENAGVLAPLYDDVCRFQLAGSYPAETHIAKYIADSAPYVDGTCMYVSREAVVAVGILDEELFGFFGWGADMDYCIRARAKGFKVVVTHSAYLNHIGRATAYSVVSDYKRQALRDYRYGMTKKYGRLWGRYLERGIVRKSLKAARSFLTSFAPQFTFVKG